MGAHTHFQKDLDPEKWDEHYFFDFDHTILCTIGVIAIASITLLAMWLRIDGFLVPAIGFSCVLTVIGWAYGINYGYKQAFGDCVEKAISIKRKR